MRNGDIVLVDLDPVVGSEAARRGPAIVVSNDGANATATSLRRGVVTVVPLTTNLAHVHPFQVELPAAETGLHDDSKARAEQVRSIDVRRVGSAIGAVPPWLMAQVDGALRTHLSL